MVLALGLAEVWMRQRLLFILVVSAGVVAPAAAEGPAIEHQPVVCVVAGRFPQLEATFTPADSVARARVQFQAEGTRHWYGVAMKPVGPAFSAVLPQPKKSLKSYRYYIEVTDTALGSSRTAEYNTTVGGNASACADKKMAGGLGSAAVTLEVPAGAPSVPGGFGTSGVTTVAAAGTAGAAVAAGATAAAAAGGGISTALLVVGGVAVAGAGAAVAVTAGGDGGGDEAAGERRTYTGPFNGSLSITTVFTNGPVLCNRTDVMSGTAMITLDQVTGALSGNLVTNGSNTPSSNNCQNGGPNMSAAWAAPVTGTAGSFTARRQDGPSTETGVAVTTSTTVSEFQGALNGGVITGTMTFTYTLRGVQPQGTTFDANGTVTIPMTLR